MARKTHSVKKGDTLTGIAKAYGTTVKKLLEANPGITDPNLIRAGQKIVIPDAVNETKEDSANKQLSVDTARRAPGTGGPLVDDGGNPVADAVASANKIINPTTLVPDSTDSGGNINTPLTQDTFSMEQLASRFSIAASILKQDASLVKALNRIMGMSEDGKTKIGGVVTDPDLAMAILKETDWFKNNTDDWRKYQFFKDSNPATYQADLKANAEAIVKKYYQMGITIDAQTAIKLAEQAMMKSATVNGNVVNYNQDYFNKLMADSIDFSKKRILPNGKIVYDLGGKVEAIAESLYKVADDYGYPATTSNAGFSRWLESNTRGLIAGTVNPEDVDNELEARAKSMYPGLVDQLNRGQSLREAADPWITALANEWEEDPKSLDLNDDFLYRILNQQDEKGNIAPMNLYQAKTMARKSPKWQYTSRAKEEYTNIGQKILQDFGFLG
jgi:phage tail protein X